MAIFLYQLNLASKENVFKLDRKALFCYDKKINAEIKVLLIKRHIHY